MAEYSLIIAIILSIAVAVVAYRVVEGVLKFAVVVLAVASVALGVAAFFVIMDANDLRESFSSGKNLVVVVDDGRAVFAMELRGGNTFKIVNKQQVDEYSENIGKGDYGTVRDGYYKLIIISTAMLGGNGTGVRDDDFFVSLVNKAFSDPVLFISEYKKGNITVYEETALFKAVKFVPAPLVKSAAGKVITKAKAVDKIEG